MYREKAYTLIFGAYCGDTDLPINGHVFFSSYPGNKLAHMPSYVTTSGFKELNKQAIMTSSLVVFAALNCNSDLIMVMR